MYFYCCVYVFLLSRIFCSVYSVSLCRSVYCLCVNVYCTAATGCHCKCVLYCCYRVSTHLHLTNISYRIMWYGIISCHVVSCQILSYHIYHMPCHISYISYHVMSNHIISYHILYLVMSYIMSCHVKSYI